MSHAEKWQALHFFPCTTLEYKVNCGKGLCEESAIDWG